MPAQINISLSAPERVELEKVVSNRMTPVRLVERAKAILMAADNIPSYKIAEHFDVDNNTIGRWRRRYAEHRMAGIAKDRPRGANQGGRMTVDQERLRQKIITKTTREKPEGAPHWSTRSMAKAMGVTHSFVNRVWQKAGLKPHLYKHPKVNNDPHFGKRAENKDPQL